MSEPLQNKLDDARRKWRAFLTTGGFALTIVIVLLLSILSFWTDRLLVLTNSGRYGWLLIIAAGLIIGFAWFVVRPLRKPISDEAVAAEVEKTYPVLNERLLTTISLSQMGAVGVSNAMVSQLALETDRISATLNFGSAIPRAAVQKPVYFASATILIFIVHFGTMPFAMSAWAKRILMPGADIPIYSYTQVWVGPGDVIRPRGDDAQLTVTAAGIQPATAKLRYRFETGLWVEAPLSDPSHNGDKEQFNLKLPALQRNLTYYAVSGDGQSNPHTITVEDRPTILNVKLKLSYPAYMNRKDEVLSATSGNIVAPVGTNVDVEAVANKPLETAKLVENEKLGKDWKVSSDTISGHLVVRKDETYGLKLTDTRGFAALNPPVYTVRAQPDMPPTVRIDKPAVDLERTPFGTVNLVVSASDDYGISDLRVDYSSKHKNGALPLSDVVGKKSGVSGGAWNLSSLKLQGGETVSYTAVAVDNDTISGPHSARSTKYNIRIISSAEMRERLEAQKAQEMESLKQLLDHQKEAQKTLAAAQRNPSDHQKSLAAEQAQRQVANDANEVLQRMQQTSEQLKDNNLATSREQQRRSQQENSLAELAKKQMPAAADNIQQNRSEQAAKQEESIKQKLEALTQKSAAAKDAFQLAQDAEKLSQEQQKLADQSALMEAQKNGRGDSQFNKAEQQKMADLAQKQKSLSQQTKALQEQLKQSAQDAAEKKQAEAGDLAKASQQMQQSGVDQKQAGAQKDLQSGKPDTAAQQQAKAAQDLQNLAQSLDQAAEQQKAREQQKSAADKMQKVADDLQAMAFKQGQLASTASRNPGKETTDQLAKQQADLRAQAANAQKQLSQMGQQSQSLSKAESQMQQSQQGLEKGQPQPAASNAKEAQRQLLQAAQEAQQAATAMNNAQEARQQQHAVEQMAKEQRNLLAQTEQIDKTRQPNTLTPDQQKRLQAAAKSQSTLSDRAKEAANDMPNQAFRWAMRQANERMNAAKTALQQNNSGEETRRRQENAAQLLERMARALGQEAQSQEEQAQNQSQQSSSQSQQQKAAGELEMARELEAQIRQETANLDERRQKNPDRKLSASQQRELDRLTNAQGETQQMTRNALQNLKSNPEVQQMVQKASDAMEDARDMMNRQQETNDGTQQKQQTAVGHLDKAIAQVQQQQRQQRQQMAQAGKGDKPGQKPGEQQAQNQPGGNNPAQKTFAPKTQAADSTLRAFDPRGKGFSGLSSRAQQAMKEGQQDRVPAEYRDLVNQYYKALSQRAK